MGVRNAQMMSVITLGLVFFGKTDEQKHLVCLSCNAARIGDQGLRHNVLCLVVAGRICRLKALFHQLVKSVGKLGRVNQR